jgi:hypothetical protein
MPARSAFLERRQLAIAPLPIISKDKESPTKYKKFNNSDTIEAPQRSLKLGK